MEVRVLLRATERYRAAEAGEEVPPYAAEEVEAMHREDLETAAGAGMVGEMRESETDWNSPEAEEVLGKWEEAARRRLERIAGGEALDDVYNDQDEKE